MKDVPSSSQHVSMKDEAYETWEIIWIIIWHYLYIFIILSWMNKNNIELYLYLRLDRRQRYKRDAWASTSQCEQYRDIVHLFIGTGRSLWGITSMPLIKAYNIDSDLHGLKSHSIFKSVYTVEASWKGTFGRLMQTASAESCFSLEDLRRRSIDPTMSLVMMMR